MIIQHSNSLLSHLTQIEALIQKIEGLMKESGVNLEMEKEAMKARIGQKVEATLWQENKKD